MLNKYAPEKLIHVENHSENEMRSFSSGLATCCCIGGIVCGAVVVLADAPLERAPSQYAPAADLRSQVDSFVERIEADLADKSVYGPDHTGRVEKDASTLAAIALVLGKHDTDHPLKKAAPTMIAAANDLADNAGDFDAAKLSLGKFKESLKATTDTTSLQWQPVASLPLLMQQVPIINNNLRRAVNSRRFEREIDKAAGLAASLAAISQASMPDTDYCEDEEAEKKWQAICAEMRDAAGDVLASVRKKDQNAARAGLERIAKTCDACHHDFRD